MSSRLFVVAVLAVLGSYSLVLPLTAVGATTATFPGVSVTAEGPRSGYGHTSAAGVYGIGGLYAAGNYNVSASADGFLKGYYPSLVAVSLGHNTTGIDLSLARSSIVTGRVTGPGGISVAGATVALYKNGSTNEVGTDTTSSDGIYAIETNVAAGVYQVQVSVTTPESIILGLNCLNLLGICAEEPNYVPGFMSATVYGVHVGAQAEVTQDEQLSASAAISGRVTFNGVGVAGVEVSVNGSCYACYSITNSTGGYAIADNLPSGTYNVTLSQSLFGSLSAHVIAAGSAVVKATTGNVVLHDFVVSASAVVSGYVKDSHGNAIAGATVEIGKESCIFSYCYMSCSGSSFLPCATNSTDATGHYVLESGIASGSYNITASKGSSEAALSSLLAVTAGTSTVAPTLTLTLSAVVTPAHITGVVKDSNGNPLKYVYVNGEGVSSHISNDTETNAQGQFNLEIPLTSTDSVNITASYTGYLEAFHVVSNVAPGATVSAGTLVLTAIQPGGISGSVQGQMIASLIQPQRMQKWQVAGGALVVTKTDSEFALGLLAGLVVSGNTISAYVQGPGGTSGTFTIVIPVSLISASSWAAFVDGNSVQPTTSLNSTYATITVTYSHSSHTLLFEPASLVTTTTTSTTPTTTSTTHTSTSTTSSTTTSTTSSSSVQSTSSTSSTSTSTTPSSTSTTHTSTSTPSTQTTSSTSSSSSGGGIPEFPYQFGAAMVLTLLVVATFLLVRKRSLPTVGAQPALR